MTAKGEMWEYVMQKVPALQKLINEFGDATLWDYANAHYTQNRAISPDRKNEFLQYVWDYTLRAHGAEVRDLTLGSLQSNYCVSTADHHGPIGHPFFFQSAILRGLTRPKEAIVNLCTSHVSLGNSSYPRGFVLHDKKNDSYFWLPFFSAKQRMSPVFNHPGFREENVEKCIQMIANATKKWLLDKESSEKLFIWFKKNTLWTKIIAQKTYSEQITLLNGALWNDIFWDTMPPLVTLDWEKIVCSILLEHLKKDSSILKNIVTKLSWQTDVEKYFDTISCCFNLKERTWTYLFWHINTLGERTALWRDQDMLVSADGNISVPLQPDALDHALSIGSLIPSGLLTYTTLSCYYGVTCFWWFAQWDYLPQIFKAYTQIAWEWREASFMHASILCEDIVLLRDEKGNIMTALDMLLQKDKWSPEKLLWEAKNTTLKDSIFMMLPEIARCL